MDEIREVEIELKRLREDAAHQKSASEALKKENNLLRSRNDYLINKLKEASYVYGEAGKRLLYFINNQVNPIVERLNNLEGGSKKLGSEDRTLAASMLTMEKTFMDNLTKLNARMDTLVQDLNSRDERLNRSIKGYAGRAEKGSTAVSEKFDGASAEFGKKLEAFRVSTESKIAARVSTLDRLINSKINMLRERSLLIGKDIEALGKFEADIDGLDGRLQETISNLSQTRLDMGKLDQMVKSTLANKKAEIEKSVSQRMNKAESGLKADFGSFRKNMEGRLVILEKNIEANIKSDKEFERQIMDKVSGIDKGLAAVSRDVQNLLNLKKRLSGLVRKAEGIDERIGRTEANILENVESFRDRFEQSKLIIKHELEKVDKKIDQRVRQVSSDISNHNSASIGKMRQEFSSAIKTREGAEAAMQAKINLILQDAKDKSEREDIKLKKQIDFIQSEVNNHLEAAEARIIKENVRSFSAARQSLKQDVHTLREENAARKAEVKGLYALAKTVSDLQKSVLAVEKKSEDVGHSLDSVSAGTSASLEKEALKVSKEIAGTAAKLKSDIKDLVAREKEGFGRQSAGLDTQYKNLGGAVDNLSKKLGELSGRMESNYQFSAANRRQTEQLSKRVKEALDEIVAWKKEYKVELGKLVKEVEG